MAALQQDVTIERGDSQAVVVTVTNLPSGGLSAYAKIQFTAKRDLSDADADAVIALSLGAGVAITTNGSNIADGVLTVTIPASITAALPGYETRLTYDVQVIDSTQNPAAPHTIAQGALLVAADVTRATS